MMRWKYRGKESPKTSGKSSLKKSRDGSKNPVIVSDDLFRISEKLDSLALQFDQPEISEPLRKITEASDRVAKAWSGSWLGYHSRVYYRDLRPVPPGARFSQEWGLMETSFIMDTRGEWVEYDFDTVRDAIYGFAGNPNLKAAEELANKAVSFFEDGKAEVLSLLTTAIETKEDSFIQNLKAEVENQRIVTAREFVAADMPTGQFITRDMVASGQGMISPPHVVVSARVMAIHQPGYACEALSKVVKRAASHLARQERHSKRYQEMGTNVFIGHGRSHVWRDLKDFIQDRLGLPWDEFNRVPVAGVTNIARLSEMLNDATIAFIVLTAEDELADGKMQARMNVIHEAGLFQGKLGFTRAIVLLEQGCEEFSNIQGLGQIRFPIGNIKSVFEEIRGVLEREEIIPPD
jgi:predicted nucleotide-binding protein